MVPVQDRDEQIPDDSGATPVASEDQMGKDALSSVVRTLTLEDLREPGVQKMVLNRMDRAESLNMRLEGECQSVSTRLESVRSDYLDCQIKLARAEQTLTQVKDVEIMRDVGLGAGFLLLGLLPSMSDQWKLWQMVYLILPVLLIGGVVFSKWFGSKGGA